MRALGIIGIILGIAGFLWVALGLWAHSTNDYIGDPGFVLLQSCSSFVMGFSFFAHALKTAGAD